MPKKCFYFTVKGGLCKFGDFKPEIQEKLLRIYILKKSFK